MFLRSIHLSRDVIVNRQKTVMRQNSFPILDPAYSAVSTAELREITFREMAVGENFKNYSVPRSVTTSCWNSNPLQSNYLLALNKIKFSPHSSRGEP